MSRQLTRQRAWMMMRPSSAHPPGARLQFSVEGILLTAGMSRAAWEEAGISLERFGVPEPQLTNELITHVATRGVIMAILQWLGTAEAVERALHNISLEARVAALESTGRQGSDGGSRGEMPLEP